MGDDRSGLDDPGAVDGVVVPAAGPVELVLLHPEPWEPSDHRLLLLQEKLNRYLEHVVDGELVAAHPEAAGRPWVVVIDCAAAPDARTEAYLRQAAKELRRHGGGLLVRRRG